MTLQVLTTQPNWSTPVLERLEWKTDVIKSRDGSEQRIKLRENPRHLMEYDFVVMKDEYRALQVQLLRWQSELWIVPLWMHTQQTTAPILLGGTRIYVGSTATYEYQVGSHLVLFSSSTLYEYLPVIGVGVNYIDVSPTTKAWSAGAPVCPARNGRLASSIKVKAVTSDVVTGSLQVTLENTLKFTYTEDERIDGLLFFGVEPNRAEPIDMEWSRNLEILDYGTGPILSYDLRGYTEIIRAHSYLQLNRSGQNRIRSLLNYCKGMWSPFLLPTFQADISAFNDAVTVVGVANSYAFLTDLTGVALTDSTSTALTTLDVVSGTPSITTATTYLSTDNALTIKSVNYTNDMFSRLTYRYLRIELQTGQVLIKQVQSSVVLSADLERLTFTTPFGYSFTAAGISRISYVNMSRLDSDAVEFTWITPNVASMMITTRGIPQ
jgi:hypothetical protein